MRTPAFKKDIRGQASTLGYIFIVGMVILSAGALAGVGIVTLGESQTIAGDEAADQAMTQLDSQMSLVAFEGGASQTVDLSPESDEQINIQEDGHITLELQEINETDPTDTDTIEVIMDRELASIEYESDDRIVAYQGGGVWAKNGDDVDSTEMVSPPEFTYEDDTATLPIVGVTPDDEFASSDGVIALEAGETHGKFPQSGEENLTNPVDPAHDLVLTIESDYYQAWGEYFDNRLDSTPIYDHDNNTVEIIIVSEGDEATVEQAITSVGSDNRIKIDGQGGGVFVDSYNSQEGPYSESQTEDGEVHAQTGIEITSGANLYGNVFTEGDIILSGNSVIHGDANYEGNLQKQGGGSEVRGEIGHEADVDDVVPIDRIIESLREEFSSENDNDDSERIDDGEITTDRVLTMDNDPTVHAGEYHLSEFDVEADETVTFDLADGDIRLVVDDDITMDRGDIEVINTEDNDHRVQVYTRGDLIEFDRSNVEVEDDRSNSMWFYSGAGTQVDLHNSEVTGVVYAPGTNSVPGEVNVQTHSALYGGVVGGDTEVGAQSSVHYDQALMNSEVFIEEHHVDLVSAHVAYFHISYTEIEVED